MIDETLQKELDPKAGMDANLQHLKHYLEGYRGFLTENENPYAPGSARAISFDRGRTQCEVDHRNKEEKKANGR